MSQVPLAPPPQTGQPIDGWLYLLWKRLTQSGQIFWSSLDFTGSNITDLATRNHADLQNINTATYTHLSSTNATDLTDGGATTLHKHDHAAQDNLNSTTYTHLTDDQKTDLLGATYITFDHTGGSLTNERALAVSTGLSKTDGGAGGALTLGQVSFVGDSGSGGFIGAVPAPASGDGAAARYLAADGTWKNPGSSGTIYHNNLVDIEGGIATNIFENTAFESTAFQTAGVTEYFHVTESDYNNMDRERTTLTTAVDASLDDDAGIIIVTVSNKTITMPTITQARIGRDWTIIQDCIGFVTIVPKGSTTDAFLLPDADTNIRLDEYGATLTLKCISSVYWSIV